MQNSIFDKLLTIRILRTDKAQREMMKRKADLEQARHHKQRKERELADYQKWRPEEEQRLLEELKQAPRHAHTLIEFKDMVRHLRDKESSYVQTVTEAAQQVAEAEAALEKARQDYAAAYRKQVKIETCQDTWNDEQRLMVEQENEKETESCMQFSSSNPDSSMARSF